MIGRKRNNSPVYDVQKESYPNTKVRTLHCDLLLPCDFLPVEQPSQGVQNLKQKTENNHKPNLNKSSKEEPFYDYDDDYDDSDGLNPQQQESFADYLSRQQEHSPQVKQAKQEKQLQPTDHDTPTDEENELVAEANTTVNEDVEPPEPEIQDPPDLVAQPTMPDQKVMHGRPQRCCQPPDYLGYNRSDSPYYIHHLPVNLRETMPQYHCTL